MESVQVNLFGVHLGDVFYDKNKQLAFRYSKEFNETNLEPSPFFLRNIKQVYSFAGRNSAHFFNLPGMLADALPDKFGSDLLLGYLKTIGREEASLTALERLSYASDRSMGALEFKPRHELISKDNSPGPVNLDLLVNLSDQVLQDKLKLDFKGSDEDMVRKIILIGTSAGGARAKAIIARNKEGHIISGTINNLPKGYRHEIIKLEGESNKDYGKTEYTYYQLAKLAGIEMMPSELLKNGDYTHFVTQRFDRTLEGEKKHIQTLAALQHLDFNYDTFTYEGIMNMINALNGQKSQIEDVFKRMVFNVVSGNRDDHAKNTSFIMNSKGEWNITPAYDLCYTYSTDVSLWSGVHHTSINGKINNIEIKDLIAVAKNFDIEKPENKISEVLDAFSKFEQFAKNNNVGKDKIDLILKNTNKIYTELNIPKPFMKINFNNLKRKGPKL